MDLRRLILILLVVLAVHHGWQQWTLRARHPGPGELAPDDPVQSEASTASPITAGRWQLTPRAHYDIQARVLGREDYRFDPLSDLIPEDLALGWGRMSDEGVLAGLEIGQSARFYSWHTRTDQWPIPREEIVSHSANTHVIPADDTVRAVLARIRVGDVVHLEGELVDGRRDDGMSVRTSLVRTDSGAGACEVFWVESVEIH
jgi:hypothetical protein